MGDQAAVTIDRARRTGSSGEGSSSRVWNALLLAGLTALAVLGAIWSTDYGVSWDVARAARLGKATLQSYRTLRPPTEADRLADLARHGPVGVTITEWATSKFASLWPDRPEYQTRFFVHFLWFTLGVGIFYGLARRWVRPASALLAAALLASQPLLLGHGFINPFDGPFVTLFAAAMLAGYAYVDALGRRIDADPSPAWKDVRSDWSLAKGSHRLALLLWFAIVLVVTADMLFLHRLVYPVLERTVSEAHSGTAWPPINGLFRLLAEDASRATFEAYQARLWAYYTQGRWVVLLALAMPAAYFLPRAFPRTTSTSTDFRSLAVSAFAGAVLGLACATRLTAPIAGLLVTFLILARAKYRSLQSLVVYWVSAAVVCYATWPSLWSSPWTSGMEFLRNTALLPFDIPVLFAGSLTQPADLPWTYLPTFILLQTTLPALALAGFGAYLAFRRKDGRRSEYLVTVLWFALPLALAIGLGATLYDNGRHYLFLWTAGFLFAGVAIEWILDWRVPSGLRIGMVAAILLPGLAGILRLHPYEYVYFNELAGGVRGAFRRYELDYWATSYREAMDYINREASPGAWIAVGSARELFDDYARPDLHLAPETFDPSEIPDLEFAMTITRA
ncbi:MAG: hypothetical protein HW375_2425, partial [Anaerolineales bacterium]|nr:hypothetical protein [Anaerolineales bacterium]